MPGRKRPRRSPAAMQRPLTSWYFGARLVGKDEEPTEFDEVFEDRGEDDDALVLKKKAARIECVGPFESSNPQSFDYPESNEHTRLCEAGDRNLYKYMFEHTQGKAARRRLLEYRAEHVSGSERVIVGTAFCMRAATMETIRSDGRDMNDEDDDLEELLDVVNREVGPLLSLQETRADRTRVKGVSYVSVFCGSRDWPGVGEKLFAYMREQERQHTTHLFLWSVRVGVGFYEKQGLHKIYDNDIDLVPMLYRFDPRLVTTPRAGPSRATVKRERSSLLSEEEQGLHAGRTADVDPPPPPPVRRTILDATFEDFANIAGVAVETARGWADDPAAALEAGWEVVIDDEGDTIFLST